MSTRISKSAYIRGLQCYKSLYLEKYHRELKVVSESAQGLIRNGYLVGEAARGLFPGGVLIPYIPRQDGQDEQVRLTLEAIESGAEVIYEAAFLFDGAFTKVDILCKEDSGSGWSIHEVKSGTSADPSYLEDIAFQYHVVTGSGLPISTANLVYINSEYIRQGELDLNELFTRLDVTPFAVEKGEFVVEELARQHAILAGEMPEQSIGMFCASPYECEYKGHCWSHIPVDSVFDLKGNGIKKDDLYGKDIVRQADIPADILKRMNAKQRQQVEATINQANSYNEKAVMTFLDRLKFPLSLFDVETFSTPIPMYDGMKPYQQTAFQYSLHVINADGSVQHREFLAEPGIDPRQHFIESLSANMPQEGSVVAYNMSFEKGVLAGLAQRFPEYQELVACWVAGMVDLMVPFRQRDIYFWRMKGSYSIKYVLPALVPELSYKDFEITNGAAAMEAYHEMCAVRFDVEKLAVIRRNLLKYCHLDTFAMVRLIEALRVLVASGLEAFEGPLEEAVEMAHVETTLEDLVVV